MRRWILGSVAGLCFASAVALTGYLGWVYWEDQQKAKIFNTAESSEESAQFQSYELPFSAPMPDGGTAKIIQTESGLELGPTNDPIEPLTVQWKKRPKKGQKIGTLRIPSLDVKVPMWAGTDAEQLSKGVGVHDLGLPGESETVALAGHRETAFKQAGKLKPGDTMILETDQGQFTYQIRKHWITEARDQSVVVSTGKPLIRMYTCYPFDSPDSPQRYVIEAALIE
ncbi:class D sortase [Kroppenstedtia sanguinis]|uniref:Class D sortase n=1 Tax=Kroppenstedtia sanguinis TaxID=1380684 RepID=A0ABW4CFW7_9BACL